MEAPGKLDTSFVQRVNTTSRMTETLNDAMILPLVHELVSESQDDFESTTATGDAGKWLAITSSRMIRGFIKFDVSVHGV